jgi:hypothetical protein
MIDIEEQLAAGMREQAAGLTLRTDVVDAAARRYRRRTMFQRCAYAAGVIGLAGALAGAVALGGSGSPAPPAAGADLRLASALAASESISYRVKVTTNSITTPDAPAMTTDGAFDPATDTGWLRTPYTEGPGWSEERLIEGVRYAGDAGIDRVVRWKRYPGKQEGLNYDGWLRTPYTEGPGWSEERLIEGVRYAGDAGIDRVVRWKRYPGKQEGLNYDGWLDGALSGSASPDDLFKALRQAGATVTETGTGAYHFKVTVKDLPEGWASDVIEGDIRLDADQRVARVEYERAVEYNVKGRIDSAKWMITMQLSGYGTAVKVEEPNVR